MRVNLSVLKKTRRSPGVGDVFVMQPPDGTFIFGRVVRVDATIGPIKNCILIYVYRARAREKTRVPELLRGELLVPPIMTNKLPWSKGYFEFVESKSLGPMDVLPKHCFHDETRGWYFDEYSKRLPGPLDPVGSWGLDSFRTIDDKVSEALGIPLAPEA